MSNSVDYYQQRQNQLAIGSSFAVVILDGQMCPFLNPVEIVRGSWPDFGWAGLEYNAAGYRPDSVKSVEEIESKLSVGRTISVSRLYSGCESSDVKVQLPIFYGRIETIEKEMSPSDEKLYVKARDFSAVMERITISARRIVKPGSDKETILLPDLESVFNPAGQANASASQVRLEGRDRTVFCEDLVSVVKWKAAAVLEYLLCEFLSAGLLQIPCRKLLETLTEGLVVHDLNVTGLNLLEALYLCCEQVGLEFFFEPRINSNGPGQEIVFVKKNDTTRVVELNCQRKGEALDITQTNISSVKSRKEYQPVSYKYIGSGDFKIYEATFELIRAWDSTLEDSDVDKFSPATNPDFYKVKNVYRRWCLNEAGWYDKESVYDFTQVFRTDIYARKPRKFGPALSRDKTGKSLGHFLEYSCDDGQNWFEYNDLFEVFENQCGIWLSSETLGSQILNSAINGTLRMRITASVVSDQRIGCCICQGSVNSAVPVVERIIFVPERFKFRKVSRQSIFYNDESFGVPDEIDQGNELYEYLRLISGLFPPTSGVAEVQTLTLGFNYKPGDIVSTGFNGRDLLGCHNDNRNIWRIREVRMDFREQCTSLEIERKSVIL